MTEEAKCPFNHKSPRGPGAAEYLDERGHRVLDALDRISSDRGARHASIAIAWLLAQPTVTAPVASARNLEQLEPLMAGVELQLTDGELELLNRASAPGGD